MPQQHIDNTELEQLAAFLAKLVERANAAGIMLDDDWPKFTYYVGMLRDLRTLMCPTCNEPLTYVATMQRGRKDKPAHYACAECGYEQRTP